MSEDAPQKSVGRAGPAVKDPARSLAHITLDERTVVRRSPEVDHERAVAIYDLIEENSFDLVGDQFIGPYHLHLSVEENRLRFDVRNTDDQPVHTFQLSLTPFRRIVKDYFQICESYFDAIQRLTPSQIEAIDMGRRGLHNDGSNVLIERLEGKVEVDFDTARRLFTLICVLHFKG